jgi:predicted metal-binding protein
MRAYKKTTVRTCVSSSTSSVFNLYSQHRASSNTIALFNSGSCRKCEVCDIQRVTCATHESHGGMQSHLSAGGLLLRHIFVEPLAHPLQRRTDLRHRRFRASGDVCQNVQYI